MYAYDYYDSHLYKDYWSNGLLFFTIIMVVYDACINTKLCLALIRILSYLDLQYFPGRRTLHNHSHPPAFRVNVMMDFYLLMLKWVFEMGVKRLNLNNILTKFVIIQESNL